MAEPLLTARAPGRVNLIGEHTDYSGGLVLPAAIQLSVWLEVEAVAGEIAFSSSLHGAAEPLAADGGGAPATGWARYVQAVAAELAALGRPSVGLRGNVVSDLPAGSGLSSSAALEVAVALALCAVADFELEPLELAAACRRAELRAVGVPCGILDQAASVLGREGAAVLLDCGTLEHRLVRLPDEAVFAIVDSGVARSLEGTAYAERRLELERALRLVGAERSTAVAIADLDGLPDVPLRRLRHVVTENERVLRFADSLEDGQLGAAGALLVASHDSLRDDYEVSIPELDLLVELALERGAYGARLLGGGFGGSVLVMAGAKEAERLGAEVATEYVRRTGRESGSLVVRPSAGATIVNRRATSASEA